MTVPQDFQIKQGGVKTKDSVYQKWLKDDLCYQPPYINDNLDYVGSITSKAPHIWAFGAGNKVI